MNKTKAVSAYRGAKKRLLLLDYDGVLAPIVSLPELAAPSARVLDLLTRLAGDPSTTCVVISGRPHGTLDEWLADIPLDFAAEHGLWRRVRGGEWEMTAKVSEIWKNAIRARMVVYEQQLPGAFIEEKHASVGLHYRNVDLGLQRSLPALKRELQQLAERFNLRVLDGKKVIEVLPASVDKGKAAQYWLKKGAWDFVLAAGDDVTDEALFAALPEGAHSIKVGEGVTGAKSRISSQAGFISFLEDLAHT